MSISEQQQQEIQKYQQMTQQLNQLNQQFIQLQARQRELERTKDALQDISDEEEIYKNVGQIMFKTQAATVKKDLSSELELLEVRVTRAKKQVEEFETRVKDAEQKLRSSIK